MSLSGSSVNITEMIRENEQHKKYFFKIVEPRFSDRIYDGKIHYSKIFEFFEMARFDIMHAFYDFFKKRSNCDGEIRLGSFVVVRVQCENFDALQKPIDGKIEIKTALTVHQRPLLEFEQTALQCDKNIPLTKTSMKLAIIDDHFKTVEKWDDEILLAMLEFIQTHGKEDVT